MNYDIHLNIPEDSQRGHLIASLTTEQHITPSQAVEHIIDLAAESRLPEAEETIGAFVERLRSQKALRGQGSKAPNLEVAESSPIFGMFAGNRRFSDAMDKVIASRAERYAALT